MTFPNGGNRDENSENRKVARKTNPDGSQSWSSAWGDATPVPMAWGGSRGKTEAPPDFEARMKEEQALRRAQK